MDELGIYEVDCENIENIIRRNKPLQQEVSVKNDEKYRSLRAVIMKQRKEIEDLKSKNKILEELVG
jgi:cell division protein FtsB